MKPNQHIEEKEDIREEYDFARMKGGVRGKYVQGFENTAVTILLDSDVAKIFPDSKSVNEALRTLVRVLGDKGKNVLHSS